MKTETWGCLSRSGHASWVSSISLGQGPIDRHPTPWGCRQCRGAASLMRGQASFSETQRVRPPTSATAWLHSSPATSPLDGGRSQRSSPFQCEFPSMGAPPPVLYAQENGSAHADWAFLAIGSRRGRKSFSPFSDEARTNRCATLTVRRACPVDYSLLYLQNHSSNPRSLAV